MERSLFNTVIICFMLDSVYDNAPKDFIGN